MLIRGNLNWTRWIKHTIFYILVVYKFIPPLKYVSNVHERLIAGDPADATRA